MADDLEIESLKILIKAVENYQKALIKNRKILENVANVGDVAMGSDDLSKKHIGRLYAALEELNKTSQTAERVAQALIEDKRRALEVYND
jgi:hypothetical protein